MHLAPHVIDSVSRQDSRNPTHRECDAVRSRIMRVKFMCAIISRSFDRTAKFPRTSHRHSNTHINPFEAKASPTHDELAVRRVIHERIANLFEAPQHHRGSLTHIPTLLATSPPKPRIRATTTTIGDAATIRQRQLHSRSQHVHSDSPPTESNR